jgi:hypothetical protein
MDSSSVQQGSEYKQAATILKPERHQNKQLFEPPDFQRMIEGE